jgi:hypothetical protein
LASQSTTENVEQNQSEVAAYDIPAAWQTVLLDWLADIVLFFATAAVVIWQNSRITVLYDLSGVLEPAFRMSLGDRPYADFPFPYAPLTFLIQTAIIRLGGTVYWHHVAYAAAAAGLATVLTWRILVNVFQGSLSWPRLTAFLFSVPIVILGIYCIFPHPFYDPDAMLFILIAVSATLWAERKGFPAALTVLAGVLYVIPLFVKQNIGLAFLGSGFFALLALIIVALKRKQPVKGYLVLALGVLAGLSIAAAIIQTTVGIETYKYWTWDFAKLRRTPSVSDMLSVYQDPMLFVWVISLAAGVFFIWFASRKIVQLNDSDPNRAPSRVYRFALPSLSVISLSIPFLWPAIYLFLDDDASERAERLVNLWPVVLIASILLWLLSVRRWNGVRWMLPLVLVCTAHGVFLSQQLWGSTYGIWPMFALMVGLCIWMINELTDGCFSGWLTAFAFMVACGVAASGAFYVYSNERLDYIDFEDGDMQHSTLPQLAGMSIRGSYLPDFEELVGYTNENIPQDDGVIYLPGEDLFYYTTGRKPRMPVLLFDVTNNPYSPEQIAEFARVRDIKWLIVKNDLQVDTDKMIDDKDVILAALKPDFRHIESLNNYEIYRRKLPGETDDEDEDDNDDNADDSPDDSGN